MPYANLTADFRDSGSVNKFLAPKVYTREKWSYPWVLSPYLRCNRAQWMLAPGTGSAELSWRYGMFKPAEAAAKDLFLPDDGRRRYVKIVFENTAHTIGGTLSNLTWYGIVNGVGSRAGGVQLGAAGYYETGIQTIQCVGLEKILDDTPIRTSAWELQGSRYYVDRGLTFNAARADGTPGGNCAPFPRWVDNLPLFSGTPIDDDLFWTTPAMLQYLVAYHGPRDASGFPLPLTLDISNVFFELMANGNNRPEVHTNGRTLRHLINQLLPHQRFASWKLDVDETSNAMIVRGVSLTGDTIVLPTGDMIIANARRWALDIDQSRSDGNLLVLSHAEAVDRCIVRGALGTSTFTISYADSSLAAGYSDAEKTDYDTGATGTAPFIAADPDWDAMNKLHDERRARDDVKMVYARFILPLFWNLIAKNGEGAGAGSNIFPLTSETFGFKPYNRELFIEPYTALREGYGYTALFNGAGNSVAPVKLTAGPFNNRPPLVLFKIPASGLDASDLAANPRWTYGDKIGLESVYESTPDDPAYTWSVHVTVPKKDRGIVLRVTGDKQHIIAGTDYTPKDEDGLYTPWDWKQMVATVTVKWDYFCEGTWPPKAALPAQDYIREVILDAGDEYRLDWLVPQTVIGLQSDGKLDRAASGGWIQDDRKRLEDRARLAFAWYGIERRCIEVATSKINGSIKLGDYIYTAGAQIPHLVNTVVTAMQIDCGPGTESSKPALPILKYTTDWVADRDLFMAPHPGGHSEPRLGKATATRSVRNLTAGF